MKPVFRDRVGKRAGQAVEPWISRYMLAVLEPLRRNIRSAHRCEDTIIVDRTEP